jgi:hypothetical protein
MEKEFVSKDIAIEMFNIGFDEPCVKFQWIDQDKPKWMGETNSPSKLHRQKYWKENNDLYTISIPTFSQCFRWFREKYDLFISIVHYVNGYSINDLRRFDTYEEAELACLKKLIEIVKTNNQK